MANEIQSIKIEHSDDAMWGNEGSDSYDVKASYAKYEEMISVKLNEIYPGVEVEFENGINDRISIDGDTAHDEIPWIQQVIEKVWMSFDWAVEK